MSDRSVVACVAISVVVMVGACAGSGGGGAGNLETNGPAVAAPVAPVDSAYALASKIALPIVKPLELPGMHNVFKLSDHIISGSEPHGEEAFQQLAAMGVKTIVSVDGKKPDAELAAKHGLRYVHIPTEYRGMSADEVLQLAKTYRECDGPFYAHCFHGKHRGPAAAEIGRLVLDGIAREQAVAEMRQWCGTAPEYEGLFRDVATRPIPSAAETRAYAFDFPSARSFGGFRDAMIAIARRDDALKKLSAKEFAYDAKNPDADAIHEAATIADSLRIAGTMAEIYDKPADFHTWLKQAADQALQLEADLTAARRGEAGALETARKSYADLTKSCTACHTTYRNR